MDEQLLSDPSRLLGTDGQAIKALLGRVITLEEQARLMRRMLAITIGALPDAARAHAGELMVTAWADWQAEARPVQGPLTQRLHANAGQTAWNDLQHALDQYAKAPGDG